VENVKLVANVKNITMEIPQRDISATNIDCSNKHIGTDNLSNIDFDDNTIFPCDDEHNNIFGSWLPDCIDGGSYEFTIQFSASLSTSSLEVSCTIFSVNNNTVL